MAKGEVTVRSEVRTQELLVPLTRDELLLKAQELSTALFDLETLKERHKGEKAEQKDAEGKTEKHLKELARTIRSKSELRPIEVYDQPNGALATVETIRMDTGAVAWTRPMTTTERDAFRQGTLFEMTSDGERSVVEPDEQVVEASKMPPGMAELTSEVEGKVTAIRKRG